jgi:polyribonucleotide nucleotidyltransferase
MPKQEVSKYAPKSSSIKIDPDKIGVVIGSGGKTIKELQESTNTVVNIDDDGTVTVTAIEKAAVETALGRIAALVKDIERGEIYEGVIEEIVDFGAFVEILPGKTGLLHVSEIAHDYVENVRDYLKVGDKVRVKVLDVDRGKISLSKKALEEKPSKRQS